MQGRTITLPFIPSVLAWTDDGTRIVAGGCSVPLIDFGTPGLAVVDTVTGALAWHLDGWHCPAVQIAGSRVAVRLFRGGGRAPSERRLAVHDLVSGEQSWRRDDIAGWPLCVDPGGRRLAVNTGDDYAVLDMSTGVDLARIALTPVPRFWPAISPTGRQVAVADPARVAIADAATGTVLHEVPTSSLALVAEFDDTGDTLTTVDMDAFVTVVDTASGNQISRSLLAETHLINNNPVFDVQAGRPVALSPDRQIVIVGGSDRIAMYSARTGGRLGTLPAANNPLVRTVFSPDGRGAVVTQAFGGGAGGRGYAKLFAAPRPRLLWEQGSEQVTAAAISRAGRLAVAWKSAAQGLVLVDAAESGPLLYVAEGPAPGAVVALGVDIAGAGIKLVVSISSDQTARLYSVEGGKLLYERQHPAPLTDVAFLHGGQSFVTACTDGGVRLFDTVSGERRWLVQHSGPVNALATSPDGALVCTASGDKTVRCVETVTGAERWKSTLPQGVTRVVVSPDAGFVVAACSDRTARLLGIKDGTERWRVRHDARIRALAVSLDTALVATASEDGSVLVLASDTGSIQRRISHVRGATSAVFSADGQAVISGSLDGAVLASPVHDPATPTQLMRAPAPVTQIVRNGADPSVAVATEDGTIRVLDPGLRAELARFRHDASARDIAIDTASGLLAAGFDDGTLRIHPWPRG